MKRKTFEQMERMAQLLSLPSDAILGSSKIEILSDKRVLVFNHEGIIEYSEEQVCINTKSRTLKIGGSELLVAAMNRTGLKITGNIKTLEFI